MSGNVDLTGFYNPVIQRCSNIACHSNGDFTWTWYEDKIAPGKIEDLAAHSGTLVGTVKLSWTPPDNDGDLPPGYQGQKGPGVYGYEIRYRTGGPVTDANWSSSTIAAGPPSAIRNYDNDPRTQTMTVYGLTPGMSYYFGVKAFDETMINHSPVSNSQSAQALVDTFAPRFQGLESARPAYISGSVDLHWSPARDDTGPITYLVYWVPSSQTIDWNNPQATTTATAFHVTGLQNGLDYLFAVRARDASPAQNVDANEVIKIAIPQSPSENDIFGRMYYGIANSGTNLGGGTTNLSLACDGKLDWSALATPKARISLMRSDGYVCGDRQRNRIEKVNTQGDIVTWVLNSTYAEATNIHGGSMSLYLRNRSDSSTITIYFDLGYWDNGFQTLDTYTRVLPRRHRGSVKAYFPTVDGTVYTVPEGKRLAIRLRRAGTVEMEVWFGSKRGASLLTVYEQVENKLPNPFSVTTPNSPTGGDVTINWTAAVDPEGDEMLYDVYGSVDGGDLALHHRLGRFRHQRRMANEKGWLGPQRPAQQRAGARRRQ
ncbi:fibronectin type III domain-containing protein [Geoalkalibacter halelectricus]|uniref:fibronectin type III domain-containing protein n=1 Tax=Geoalkalibacter halelectricus TaxID=2847045 RepID=UPI00345FC76C